MKFYIFEKAKNYVPEEKTKKINRNPDWLCGFCGSYNSDSKTQCNSCGANRESDNKTYFDVQNEQQNEKCWETESTVQEKYTSPSSNETDYELENEDNPLEIPKNKKGLDLKIIGYGLAGVLGLILLIWSIIALFVPKEIAINISEFSWNRTIEIERYQTVQESDWDLPSNARHLYSRREFYEYEEIIDYYETKTRKVEKERFSHYDYQSVTKDLGNGYFEEETIQIPVYVSYYEDETYKEPVYKTIEVYKTKYYYEVDKWIYERSVKTQGNNRSPYWGEI